MLFIYRNGKDSSLRVPPSSLAISSRLLNVPVNELKFSRKISSISKDELAEEIKNEVIKVSFKRCVIFKSNKMVISGEQFDWKLLILFYAMRQLSTESNYNNVVNFIESNEVTMKLILDENTRHRKALETLTKSNHFIIFNAKKLALNCRKEGLTCKVLENGGLEVKKRNVSIGNMDYESINLLIVNWEIANFMFKFKEFDYNSNDKYILLHPKLHSFSPYGEEAELKHCVGYYSLYAKTLAGIIEAPNDSMLDNDIRKNFESLLRLWNDIRYTVKDREELSHRILKYYLK